MTQIVSLKIRNFRGIESLDLKIPHDQKTICLIGRGDSGKTTILDAIAAVLSPKWNMSFYDTDFFKCDATKSIEICAKLIGFPDALLSDQKFGLYAEGYKIDDNQENEIPSITVKLTVNKTLEPSWTITNARDQEDARISATERSLLNCFMISDYVDQHFTWRKGSPLYSLQKHLQSGLPAEGNVIIDALREAKERIDEAGFEDLVHATNTIEQQSQIMGLNIQGTNTTLDARDLSIKDGSVSLHENTIPFRNKGKGTKRLASLAIQTSLVASAPDNGIILIDELEQGLEPDRIKHLTRYLKEEAHGQVFLTTHSRDAIQEIGSGPILHLNKNLATNEIRPTNFNGDDKALQKAVRACPEAFFAKKVIICEGATEVGICRALDAWRRERNIDPMAFQDCAYVDGTGSELAARVDEIHKVGISIALLCDTDNADINSRKDNWKQIGINIFDCEDQLCIEQQVFADLTWAGVIELVDYVLKVHKNGDSNALNESISAKCSNERPLQENWRDHDTLEIREAIAEAAIIKRKEWFKSVGHGEKLGRTVLKYIDEIDDNAKLKTSLLELSNWIGDEV